MKTLMVEKMNEYLFRVDGKPVLAPTALGKTRNRRNEVVPLVAVS